jgi:hypothetical protein
MLHRVLCFGGRDFSDMGRIDAALSLLPGILGSDRFAIVHGNARGADKLCGLWGKRHGLCVIAIDANWDYYRNNAGPVRNQWMLDFCHPTYGVGFPGGSGTRDMAERLRDASVPVWWPLQAG